VNGPAIILFGKLPSRGDFLVRGLDPARRAAWDRWVCEGLDCARRGLGAGFEAAYGTAPPLCFVLGPGRFGTEWRAGMVAPSVDAAGRLFPLVLAADGLSAGAAAAAGREIAERLEEVGRQAIAGGLEADRAVEAGKGALAPMDARADGAPEPRWWTRGGEGHAPHVIEGGESPDVLIRAWTPAEAPA
jgi:type VI secretion system protein ImpM